MGGSTAKTAGKVSWLMELKRFCSEAWNCRRSVVRRQLLDFATSPTRQHHRSDGLSGSCCCSPEQPLPHIRSCVEWRTISRIQQTSIYVSNTSRRCVFQLSPSATRTFLQCQERRISVSCVHSWKVLLVFTLFSLPARLRTDRICVAPFDKPYTTFYWSAIVNI